MTGNSGYAILPACLPANLLFNGPDAGTLFRMMKKPDPPISYRSSGVNIDSMDEAIRGIRDLAASTFGPEVLAGVGGFGGIFRPALKGFEDPVLVASADGVGTKIKVAARMGVYDSVGRDLVNHCVNDILCQGAVPLFFMDYVAVGKLEAASG